MKIYYGKDGRKRVYKKYDDGSKKVITYARHLMEERLGRKLRPDETVDHIDRDRGNDIIDNLRIVGWGQHASDDNKRAVSIEITCVLCGRKALKSRRHIRHNAKQGKAGPFCGKSCAGKYSQGLQVGKNIKLPIQKSVDLKHKYIDKPAYSNGKEG